MASPGSFRNAQPQLEPEQLTNSLQQGGACESDPFKGLSVFSSEPVGL